MADSFGNSFLILAGAAFVFAAGLIVMIVVIERAIGWTLDAGARVSFRLEHLIGCLINCWYSLLVKKQKAKARMESELLEAGL